MLGATDWGSAQVNNPNQHMSGENDVLTISSMTMDGPVSDNRDAALPAPRSRRQARVTQTTIHGAPVASCLSWTAAGAVLVNWSIQLLGSVTTYSWVASVVIVAGIWGLVAATLCWLPIARSTRLHRWRGAAAWATLILVVGCYVTWSFLQIHASPAYGTDEIAFDQYAAVLARHGLDPYLHSMAQAFTLYRVSPDGFTYHLNGTPVTSLSYPALAFLPYVPFLLLGWSTQLAVVLNAVAWGVSIVLLFVILPREVRALALVIGSIAAYGSYAIGGVTDMLYIPLLIGAAYEWNGFVHHCGWRRYRGPVLLGLAMCVKQTPWLVAPFFLAGIVLEARASSSWRATIRSASCYVAGAATGFLVPNLAYIAMSPTAWLHGVLTPFSSSVVPAGQGLVGLSLYLRLGGGSLAAYSLLAGVVYIVLLACYVLTYPLLRPVTVVLASLVLFFASRSFGSYLVALLPVMVVAALTTEQTVRRQPSPQTIHSDDGRAPPVAATDRQTGGHVRRRALVVVGVALPCAAVALALTSRPALDVAVTGVRTTGQLATVEQLTVRATNDSSAAVHPHFTVDEGGAVTTFWQVSDGPHVLRPGEHATYTLRAPNYPAQPSIGGGFAVMAFTTHPASVSVSTPYVPDTEHLALTPGAVNAPVPLGTTVKVTAQLLDQMNRPIHEAGVPVYLGQIIYDQLGLVYSEAVVNGGLPGATPVTAYTNSSGEATFDIVGTQVSQDPVYFEANLVSGTEFYPYGYSQILAIRFTAVR